MNITAECNNPAGTVAVHTPLASFYIHLLYFQSFYISGVAFAITAQYDSTFSALKQARAAESHQH